MLEDGLYNMTILDFLFLFQTNKENLNNIIFAVVWLVCKDSMTSNKYNKT